MSDPTGLRLETDMENIARSIREGVFPKKLEPIMVPSASREKQLADKIGVAIKEERTESLELSKSDWLVVVNALSDFAVQEYGEDHDPVLKFGRALSDLPVLAKAAGVYVGVKVTAARGSVSPKP